MKTFVLEAFGGVENLLLQEQPLPTLQPEEVLVQVKAIALNPVDVKTRAGKGMAGRMKDLLPHLVLGWDISGIVSQVGSAVQAFQVGDEVFGMVNFPGHGQAYAEYVAAPASHLAKKPSNVSHAEAAAATLAALTAWQALVTHTTLQKGDRVLIHAAAGGVGHYAVQIAKQLGAYVIGTSSAAHRDFLLNFGVDEHVDYHQQPFEQVVAPVDFVLDTIAGDVMERSLQVIKPGGKLISIPSGMPAEIAEKAKGLDINASFFLVSSNGSDMQTIANWLEEKKIVSHVSHTFPFEQLAQAHLQVETGRTRGKIVVTL